MLLLMRFVSVGIQLQLQYLAQQAEQPTREPEAHGGYIYDPAQTAVDSQLSRHGTAIQMPADSGLQMCLQPSRKRTYYRPGTFMSQ